MSSRLQRSRALAFSRQGGKCFYCGLRMWLGAERGPEPLRCTAEHLLAKGQGGRDDPTNIVAAHSHCNQLRHRRKHAPEPEQFRLQARRRVERGAWFPGPVLAWARTG